MTGRPRSVSIYQSLLVSLALVIVLLGGATLALTFVGSKQTAETLAGVILEKTVSQVDLNLRQFFEPATRDLELLRGWEGAGLLAAEDAAAMNRLLVPLLRANRQLSALMVADERGHEHIVFHFGDSWSSRQTRRDTWGPRAAWLEWSEDGRPPIPASRPSDYDPQERPWYRGALQARGRGAASGPAVYWTEPYVFYTAQAPALLKRPEDLDTPMLARASRALSIRPPDHTGPLRLRSGAEPWWVDLRPFPLGPDRRLQIEVMVPESDLLGGLAHLRLGIGLVMAVALGLGMVYSVHLARRYSRPLAALVGESERISRGDLEGGPSRPSSIREVHRLTEAHERMRGSLRTLLKLERDLQVARRIQQDTLPERIPAVPGFDIDAWNEPAEETGGDTYDVIGCRREPGESGPRIVATDAERAVLLLADASGHGIGPALSVTQVRAMLRMAVRVGQDLPAIVRHLNAQLCADLTEGRFIAAWVGELDARTRTLTSFSCGQGPLLYYRAAAGSCETLGTDTVPLGCLDDLAVVPRDPIRMEPGDIFAVLSDGVIDSESATGERFGTRRVIDVVTSGCGASAAELTAALRRALAAFTDGAPPADDRTAVFIKCG